jgi:predicted ester cyclase
MSSQDLRARVETLLGALNRRDYKEVAKLLSPDVVLVDHIRRTTVNGPEAFTDRFKPMMDAFPDMVGETTSLFANGNVAAAETLWRGTHTSPLVLPTMREIEPTNQQVNVYIAVFLEFDQKGNATAIRTYGNPTETMLTITATPAGGTG